MHSISKAVFKFFLVVFFIIALEGAARLCYENWDNQTVQSKMEREELKGMIDTLYCGSSLAYYAYCPEILDEALGTNSFNLGTASQRYIGTYYLIRDAAEENPIKQVYVTISLQILKRKRSQFTPQYLSGFENMRTCKWKLAYLAAVQREDVWISSLIYTTQVEEYFDYESIKTNLTNKLVTKEVAENYAGRGWRLTKKKFKGAESKQNSKNNSWNGSAGEAQILEEELLYLNKIADFCREQGIHLTFVVLPYTQVYLDSAGDLDDFNEYLKEKTQGWGADYLNFIMYKDRQSVFTDDKFKDTYHMNVRGTKAFDSLLAEVIQSEHPEDYFYDSMDEFRDKEDGDIE